MATAAKVEATEEQARRLAEGVLDASEGTGQWIAEWEMGPSTGENLLRPWLRVRQVRQ